MFFLALVFSIHCFFLSGFIGRLYLSPLWKNLRKIPTSLEYIVGYAFTSLFCLLSLIFFDSFYYGAILACLVSFYSIKKEIKSFGTKDLISFKITLAFIIKFAFLVVIILIYAPVLLGQATHYYLPSISDLPKHISAVVAVAHADSWPVLNPFFPDYPYTYYLCFYVPLGVIARLLQSTTCFPMLIAISVIWVTWHTLGLLEIIMSKWQVPKRFRCIGLLLATFIGGYISVFNNTDDPTGFLTGFQHFSFFLMEDSLSYFIYFPQHLFSLLCLLAAWFVFFVCSPILIRTRIICSFLLVVSVLTDYIIVPIVAAFFVVCFMSEIKRAVILKKKIIYCCSLFLPFALIALPILWQVKKWTMSTIFLTFLPFSWAHWGYIVLSFGPVIFLALFSISYFKSKIYFSLQRSYLILIFLTFFYLLIPNTDFQTKGAFYLHVLLILPGTLGFVYCWNKVKQKFPSTQWFVLALPLMYSFLLSTILIGYYISGSYLVRSQNEENFLLAMKSLPFNAKILLLDTNYEKMVLSGHLGYMNFFPIRGDGYLPAENYGQVKKIFDVLPQNFLSVQASLKTQATVAANTNQIVTYSPKDTQ